MEDEEKPPLLEVSLYGMSIKTKQMEMRRKMEKENMVTSTPLTKKAIVKNVLIFILLLSVVAATIWISFLQFRSPEVLPHNASIEQFSAQRAMNHLKEFAIKPHPIGTKEHDRVRDYLMTALTNEGLTPQIQKTDSVYTKFGLILGGKIENIVARIPGKDSSKAIMLVAHYDSATGGPGAADAGAGVASILETVRILSQTSALKNDVIILLSDGEESGLLGAQAFVEHHPWAKDVGLVLNFEARGNNGPVLMFETSEENGTLISEFIKAAPHPFAHSSIYTIYKLMPNDTDLTVFKNAGMNGLNFGFFADLHGYHTTHDNIEEISLNSIQHHGEYMLSLVQHFGNMNVVDLKEENKVFFNILGHKVATYSEQLVTPFMIFIVLGFVLSFVHGYKRKKLTIAGTSKGFLVFLLTIILAFIVGLGLWSLLSAIFSEKSWIMETDSVIGNYFLIGFVFILFSILSLGYQVASKKIHALDLTMGASLGWLLLLIAASFLLEGVSYVFAWPLLFGLIGINVLIVLKNEHSIKEYVISVGFAIPAILIAVPVIYLIFMLLTLKAASVLLVLISLLGAFVIPVLSSLKIRFAYDVPATLFILGLLFIIGNGIYLHQQPSKDHPKASDISYFKNADTNKAYWATFNELDDYSSHYIGGEAKRGSFAHFSPLLHLTNMDLYYGRADLYKEKPPTMKVIANQVKGKKRTIEFQMKSNRRAEELHLSSAIPITVYDVKINGKKVPLQTKKYSKEKPFQLKYTPEAGHPLTITLVVDKNSHFEWLVSDYAYRIPEQKGKLPLTYTTYGDSSFVLKTYKFR